MGLLPGAEFRRGLGEGDGGPPKDLLGRLRRVYRDAVAVGGVDGLVNQTHSFEIELTFVVSAKIEQTLKTSKVDALHF